MSAADRPTECPTCGTPLGSPEVKRPTSHGIRAGRTVERAGRVTTTLTWTCVGCGAVVKHSPK